VSPAKTAFYASVATAIPVLLVGYIVEVSALSRRISDALEQIGTGASKLVLEAIQARYRGKRFRRFLLALSGFWVSLFTDQARTAMAGPVLAVGVLLPALGEFSALAALAGDDSTTFTQNATWVGLAASWVVLIAPAFQFVSVIPIIRGFLDPGHHSGEPGVAGGNPASRGGEGE
jgi:hypothetical protein